MKKLLIIGNWKANKNQFETQEWFQKIADNLSGLSLENKELVICVPFINVDVAKASVKKLNLPIKIGCQDVSKFENGAYTGEVTAEMLKGVVDYCIIGHSERRKYFHETNEDVLEKLSLLLKNNIAPVLCISDLSQFEFYVSKKPKIKELKEIIFVYEPPSAISGGKDYKPVSVETVSENLLKIKEVIGQGIRVLYGASINSENAKSLFTKEEIDGGLSGQASLDPLHFLKIIDY
ncbi:MAG: hypothetical protein A2W22_05345 [Candidatus Levybacteria bacterium RBG_16_35_11]|nr:MAG: hypothetical protein A2W22_05345 [Candidatus Levybacteria bacterium RBG_16_35_11]